MSYPTLAGLQCLIFKPMPAASDKERELESHLEEIADWEDGSIKERAAFREACAKLEKEQQAKLDRCSRLETLLARIGSVRLFIKPAAPERCLHFLFFEPDTSDDAWDFVDYICTSLAEWQGADCEWLSLKDLKAGSVTDFLIRDGVGDSLKRCDGSIDAWARKNAISATRAKEIANKLGLCGSNADLFLKMGSRNLVQQTAPVSFLVGGKDGGLIPFGLVTVMVGKHKSGKSTLLTELACGVGRGDATCAGFDLNLGDDSGFSLLCYGEDTPSIVGERFKTLDPEGMAHRFHGLDAGNFKDLKLQLAEFENLKVSLLVVDPLRKYLAGDEDSSGPVSETFGVLEEFAAKTGAAVVVAHHIGKNAHLSSLRDVVRLIRGSSVIADRARVILGLVQRPDGMTGLGIARDGDRLLHNIPPTQPVFDGERILRRDVATQRHLPVDPEAPPVVPEDTLSAVREAIKQLTADDNRITQTGKHELFMYKAKAPKLAGKTRAMVRDAVAAGLASGQLVLDGRQVRCA